MKLTHGELFAGIGGFGIGFDNVGAVTKWNVEIDKHCQSILSRHWPNAQIESDVCEVGKRNLSPVDIISFGSPCQDLSIAGKRKGFQDGTRSNLFFEAVRIIQELNPRYAVWENVPGALSSHGGHDFQSVLESLLNTEVPMPQSGRWATAGMVRSGKKEIAWRCLDAQHFGVPQRRKRIFLVFCPRGDSAAEVLFECEGVPGNTSPSREVGKEVTHGIRVGAPHSGERVNEGKVREAATVDTVAARDHKSASDLVAFTSRRINYDGIENKSPTLNAGDGGMGAPAIWEMSHASKAVRENRETSPTLLGRMGTGISKVPLVGVRRLTPTECLRLQGFPDNWLDGESDTAKYRQCGNAVAVPVVEWIAKRIVALT